MNNQWGRLFAYFVGITLVTVGVVLVPTIGDWQWMPESIAKESKGIDALFWGLVVLSVLILAVVMAVVVYSVVHFKAARGDESDGSPIHGNHRLEMIWTLIPTVIVIVVGVVSYVIMVDNEKAVAKGKSQPVVQVRAFSFGWAFGYGEREALVDKAPVELTSTETSGRNGGGQTEGERGLAGKPAWKYTWQKLSDPDVDNLTEASNLVLPVGKRVFFEVMSCSRREPKDTNCGRRHGDPLEKVGKRAYRDDDFADVNHAFWVPEARMKIDAIAGLPTWTQWTPSETTGPDERYQVVCAELCGSGHNGMRVEMCVVDQETFDWWLENAGTGCDVLRYFNCPGLELSAGERADAGGTLEQLLTDTPDADCAAATKEIA